jgi:hypothetical protein
MKPIVAIALPIALLFAGHSTVIAQESAGTQVAAANDAIVLTVEVDTPVESVFGFIRTTIAPGGSARFSPGSGPAIRFVERGSIHLRIQENAVAIIAWPAATPATIPAGEHTVESGMAFIVAKGGAVELRNDSPDPATILELLSASDATMADEVDVSHLVLAQRDYLLPAGAVTITLSQQTLAPGDQFDWPADPAVTTLYPLERSDAFLLTGQGFNRGTHPIAFYTLTITPVTG